MTEAPSEQHLERLSRAFEAVDNWHKMTSSAPLRCRPGSALREDDRANPSHPVSVPTWVAIVQSVEHLNAIGLLFQGTGALFPSAYFSMARPALLGACRAVWILSPEQREERQRRAWLCRKEEADGVIGMTSDILPNQRFNALPNASELRATAEKSRTSAKVIDDDLIALLKARGSRTRIDLTKMLNKQPVMSSGLILILSLNRVCFSTGGLPVVMHTHCPGRCSCATPRPLPRPMNQNRVTGQNSGRHQSVT